MPTSDIKKGPLYVDSTNNRVGIGTTSPATALDLGTTTGAKLTLYPSNYSIGVESNELRIASNAVTSFYSGGHSGTERMHLTADGRLGIGTSSPGRQLHVKSSNATVMQVESTNASIAQMTFVSDGAASNPAIGAIDDTAFNIQTGNLERLRINSDGRVTVSNSNVTNPNVVSSSSETFTMSGALGIVNQSNTPVGINRDGNDGELIAFRQATVKEGGISVSGTTVSYNGGHLSRWSQLADNTKDETIVKGTVLTNLDQMAVWTNDGVTEENEQLNCMAVSSVEGDPNVAGVFVNWDEDDDIYTNDMNVAMTGDMVIRITSGTTIARGDLLMSAGDGTAKPQGDDIVRSKTIAKVTSTNVSHTYDDGSYLVPCVLMAC